MGKYNLKDKPPKTPAPAVKVKDTRVVTVEYTLEGIEAALIEAARAAAAKDGPRIIPDDPLFVGVKLDLTADQDGENVELRGATITFEFARKGFDVEER